MRDLALDSWILFGRLFRASVRMPVWLAMSVIQPLFWLLVFGQLFRRVVELPGFEGASYSQFLAPGVAVMTALFGAAFSGMGMLSDMDSGVLDRLLATPVRRGAVIAARMTMASTQVVMQATVILGVSFLLGARPATGILGVLAVYLSAGLLGAAAAGFSSFLALTARRMEIVIAVTNLLITPLIFTSSIMMSPELMPPWIRTVAAFNPVNWAVVAGRLGYQGGHAGSFALHLGLLALLTAICIALSARAFRRYRKNL